jgi:hypothetical protein
MGGGTQTGHLGTQLDKEDRSVEDILTEIKQSNAEAAGLSLEEYENTAYKQIEDLMDIDISHIYNRPLSFDELPDILIESEISKQRRRKNGNYFSNEDKGLLKYVDAAKETLKNLYQRD